MSVRPLIHFAHANGFPSACYEELFLRLRDAVDVVMIPVLGADPAYPPDRSWTRLVDQVADSVRRQAQGRRVIALGHSMGAMTSFMAQQRYPDLFSAMIMMDPAYIPPAAGLMVGLAKLTGQIDKVTPAGRSLGRRSVWASREEAGASLRHKALFRDFTEACFADYLRHGLRDCPEGVCLTIPAEVEVEVFRHTPSNSWRYQRHLNVPLTVMAGETSIFTRKGSMHQLARSQGVPLQLLPGGHLFPFEQPEATAQAVLKALRAMGAFADDGHGGGA